MAEPSMESTDREGRTELFYAAEQDDPVRLRHCLDKGANINARNLRGETALLVAARGFCLNAASFLIASGAQVDLSDQQGNTPLYHALFNAAGRAEMVRLLVAAGADKDHRNRYGLSPWDLAKSITKFDAVQFMK